MSAPPDLPAARLEEERKLVSVLFVDIVGFTTRSEGADPEDVRATLRAYHTRARREIERFGGTVEKFIGDAVMAVFGAPVAHEDDPERAVRAALHILEAIDELNEAQPELELAVRAAVNTGEALVSVGARPEVGEGIVAGDVVNTASRLQQVAPVGSVVVGELACRSTGDVIDYEELEAVDLKGKAEPVRLWRARGARSRVRAERASTTPFVGRTGELALLTEAHARTVRDRTVALVTITGEPGAGKSRLVGELRAYVDERPELVFWRQGQCLPYGEGITFWALGEIVKAQAGILESDRPEQAAAKIGAAVAAVVEEPGDREWLGSSLAPLVGAGGSRPGGAERGASFTAWRRFFEAVAARRPLVLAFEDLHWADTALVEFVEHLVDWATDVPLLVVCTARPELYERHPGWGGGRRPARALALSPLSDEETARLIGALLADAPLPAETQAALLERAGGNPLFAEEFVRMVGDRGNGPRTSIPVPETLHALISARLDALSPFQKSIALDAAVVGEVFWAGALSSMGELDELAVEQALHELARKDLVRPARVSSVQGQAEYSFWHILVRDVAYGQIPRLARIGKHRAAAAWIEQVAGERVIDHAELLVHHYGQALALAEAAAPEEATELEAPAGRFLVLAGDRAFPLDVRRAEAYYRRALALLPPGDPERANVLVKIADSAQEDGRLREAAGVYEEAIAELRAGNDLLAAGEATGNLARALWRLGETARSRGLLTEAVAALEGYPPGPELAVLYTRLAGNHVFAGHNREGVAWSEKALSLAETLGLEREKVRMLQMRGLARRELGDPEGLRDLEQALRLGLELGLGIETATSYLNLGNVVFDTEGPARAMELFRDSIDFSEKHGLTHNVVWTRAETVWSLFDLGDWDELLHVAEEVIEWDRSIGGSQITVATQPVRALVLAVRGRAAEAASLVNEFLPAARAIGDTQVLAPALSVGALVEHVHGDSRAAVGLLEEFEETTRGQSSRAHHLPDTVRIASAAGAAGLAVRLTAGAAEGSARHRHAVLAARAVLAEAGGNLSEARELYADAAARWAEYGHVFERGLALLGEGRCLVALGSQQGAPASLAEAREILSRLGARPLLAEVERLRSSVPA